MRRVVVVGIGAVSPCGADVAKTWDNVSNGRSGIAPIQAFDTTDHSTTIAGECSDFDALNYIEKKRLREGGRFIHLAIGASEQAVASSGFASLDDNARDRAGTFIGVGFCGIDVFAENQNAIHDRGPRRVSPYFVPATISNLAAGQVSMRHQFRGPSYAHTSACASGAHAIGDAFRWIQFGKIDYAIAGGAEATVTPLGVAGFAAMRALSKRNDEPTLASRPFDAGRDGFVMGEGAGILALESLDSARARGANILAEIVGYGATSDAYHMTQPAPEGAGAQRAMRAALSDASIDAAEVDYVNAHGTSTPAGDEQELMALRAVFGAHATNGLRVSSTKGVTGHLLGAAGGLESVLCIEAIRHRVLPPTVNLDNADPAAAGVDLVANKAQEREAHYVLNNSFGFGGTNCALLFRRFV